MSRNWTCRSFAFVTSLLVQQNICDVSTTWQAVGAALGLGGAGLQDLVLILEEAVSASHSPPPWKQFSNFLNLILIMLFHTECQPLQENAGYFRWRKKECELLFKKLCLKAGDGRGGGKEQVIHKTTMTSGSHFGGRTMRMKMIIHLSLKINTQFKTA